ncbi:MAG: alpha-2-macroglobulin domain protein [Moraxellaceae bacterium]|nr:alpha-2-macroglobulin domain protein [Moraxellaceae bacterium]
MERPSRFLAFLKSVFAALFGRLSWQPPAWLAGAGSATAGGVQQARRHWRALAAVLVLGGGLWAGYPYIKKWLVGIIPDRPELHEVTVQLTPPSRTVVEEEKGPNPLVLEFSRPAAPLAGIGKPAADVKLSPAHPGRWVWVTDARLEFQPAQDWPVGAAFEVEIGKKALAAHVTLDEREYEFRSAAFVARVQSAEFYQDPVQAGVRKAVFELEFTHPVQPAELEKHLRLQYGGSVGTLFGLNQEALPYSVVYDKYRVRASVQSMSLPIPEEPRSIELHIAEGMRAQRGGPGLATALVHAVPLPGLYSLAIERMEDTIVTGEDGDPEHVLQIQTNMPVHEREMARALSAWVLPPRSEIKGGKEDDWDDIDEITDAVLNQSASLPLAAIPQEREAGEAHAFRFTADPGRQIVIRVAKGLTGVGGFRMGTVQQSLLRVRAYAPELTIMSRGALLALDGEKKLPLLVRDLPGVHVEIARVLPQQLHALVTQSDGAFTQPDFYGRLTPDDLSERFERSIPLKLKPGKTHYEPLDFGEYLHNGAGEKRGIFLLSVRGWAPGKSPETERSPWQGREYDYEEYYEGDGEEERRTIDPSTMKDRRLVIVTDLGFLLKRGTDGAEDVFVQSLGSGNPVADATVEVWGRNGLVIAAQRTDADGHARLPNLSSLKREKRAVMIAVRKGDDLSFMPLGRGDRNLDMSRFDVGGAYTRGLPNQTRAYLFSDRGIYRPGDTIRIGAIVKSADWTQATRDLPLEAEIIDARGLVAKREPVTVGAAGMLEIAYTTFDYSPTGNYTINLNLARKRGSSAEGGTDLTPLTLGSVAVKVQEFQPDRMKLSARLSRESLDGWVHPRDLAATVSVQNLFGTPAPDRRVEAKLTLRPAYPSFRKYPDYAFFDPQRAKQEFTQDLETKTSDAQGNVTLDLGLDNYGQATYQLHLLVKAFEPEGGRNVAAEVGTLVSDLPWLVGFKADGNLDYVDRGATRIAMLLAIDPQAKPVAVNGLKLQHVERRVVSVLVKHNGLYRYESRAKEVVLKESTLNIPAAGFRLALDSKMPGNFAYVLRNADGLEMNRVAYSVAGAGNVSRSLDRNAELQLALDKPEYHEGEEIEISIRAPYTGAGLITIERDRVYSYQWFRTDKTSSVQKIRVPKGFEGNGYVMVQFVRDPASDEIYMSPLSYGVVPFRTGLAAKTTPAKLHAPALVKPGQTVKMRLEAPVPVRAMLFAVDEGILQVARYQNPDPLKFFFAKRALEVDTQQTLDLILPEFRKLMQAAAPGGDADGALGKHLNPFKRRTDAPIAWWSGIVDVSGSHEFTYTVPERFNGQLRIIAVTATDSTVNAMATSTQVRGNLILLPTVPVSLTPGDEVEIGVGVANNLKGSGKAAPVTLRLQTSPHLEVLGGAAQTLAVSENGEAATKFRIRAKTGAQARLGSTDVVFTAQLGKASARLGNTLSVRPASPFVSLVQTGQLVGSGELAAKGNFYTSFARSEVAVSSTPWSFASGLLNYLVDYPANTPLKRTLSVLRSRQGADGGFGLWDSRYVEPFATTYATHLLLEARERKLAVPEDVYHNAFSYLQNYVANGEYERYHWRNRAYAAYLLTRQGTVVTAALTNLRSHAPQEAGGNAVDLGMAWLAASYQLQKQDQQAAALLDPVWQDFLKRLKEKRHLAYRDRYYDPLVHDSMLLYIVSKHFPARLRELPPDTFVRLGAMVQEGGYHSLSSSSTILAIDAYSSQATKVGRTAMQVGAIDAQGKLKALPVKGDALVSKALAPVGTARVKLSQDGGLPLYYSWTESGYTRDVPATPESRGLEIVREFLGADGKPVSEVSVGDDVTVRLRLRALDKHYINDVAVADILPGGLEPVLTAPGDSEDPDVPLWRQRLGGSGSWNLQYADIREDRVLFYGDVHSHLVEISYKARATNPGRFVVPAAWGEAMYDRKIFARSAGGSLVVKPVAGK